MSNNFSAFSLEMRLFQSQSLLGFVSMTLPIDSKYDSLRELLFNAHIAILKCSDEVERLSGEKPTEKGEI